MFSAVNGVFTISIIETESQPHWQLPIFAFCGRKPNTFYLQYLKTPNTLEKTSSLLFDQYKITEDYRHFLITFGNLR